MFLRNHILLLFFITLGPVFFLFSQKALAEDSVSVEIFGPGQKRINVFVAEAAPKVDDLVVSKIWKQFNTKAEQYLSFLPFLYLMPGGDIIGGPDPGGYKRDLIDFKKFSLSQVDLVLTAAVEPKENTLGRVEMRAYEVYTQRLIVGRAYVVVNESKFSEAILSFCASLMEALSGKGDFFRSKLAFVRKNGTHKEIWSTDPFGENRKKITRLAGINLSPSWSKDGHMLAFTHLGPNGHRLGVLNNLSGSLKLYSMPGDSCISPNFLPDGRIALSLDHKGSPDIYLLSKRYRVQSTLARHWAIDISPDFDESGENMVFVSSRYGNPHIFLKNLKTGEEKRITFEGKYNTSPSISNDGNLIAFSRMTDEGHRIFVYDVEKDTETQITFGPGNDEDPDWAADGYFLAFSSNRKGSYKIYLTTRFGEQPRLISTGPGEATAPAWGISGG